MLNVKLFQMGVGREPFIYFALPRTLSKRSVAPATDPHPCTLAIFVARSRTQCAHVLIFHGRFIATGKEMDGLHARHPALFSAAKSLPPLASLISSVSLCACQYQHLAWIILSLSCTRREPQPPPKPAYKTWKKKRPVFHPWFHHPPIQFRSGAPLFKYRVRAGNQSTTKGKLVASRQP